MKPVQEKVKLEAIQKLGRKCTKYKRGAERASTTSPPPKQESAECKSSVAGRLLAADLCVTLTTFRNQHHKLTI